MNANIFSLLGAKVSENLVVKVNKRLEQLRTGLMVLCIVFGRESSFGEVDAYAPSACGKVAADVFSVFGY